MVYKLVRADHPSNTKRGGVCAYFKESLSVKTINTIYLNECLVFEITLQNKRGYVVSLYRSPSQSPDEFDEFLNNFENLLNVITSHKVDFIFILGDFNARTPSWWKNDSSTSEGTRIEALTSFYGLTQIISEPTHILQNSASCIDLIFTNQPNIVIESGVHPSLHPNCHHQLIFSKANLKIFYPPPYKRLVWDYNKANINAINQSIDQFDWDTLFLGKEIENQISLFNTTLLNIFKNFIPNKLIVCNDKDPPWINDKIKELIKQKNELFKCLNKQNTTSSLYPLLEQASTELSNEIITAKNLYYARMAAKLNNPSTSPKTYWSILKSFLNGKKVPVIPPLIHDNQLVTDFLTKANLFNTFFNQQCSLINNDSSIPSFQSFLTDERLSNVDFGTDDILKIIHNLDPNKAHGHDGISIRMVKLCATSLLRPLFIVYSNCLKLGYFPNEWKKANVVPIQ